MFVPIHGGTTAYINPQFNPCVTLNCYSVLDKTSKWGGGLTSWPGSKKIDEKFVNGHVRAIAAMDSTNQHFLFAVMGNSIFIYNTLIIGYPIGQINSSAGYVGIDNNLRQVVFVDGVNGWYANLDGSGFTKITFPDALTNPVDITYLDGRLIVADGNSNRFYISAQEDASSWASLDFASLTTNPEVLVAIKEKKRRIFVMGKETTEVFFDAGAQGFPFVRDNNMIYSYGAVSASGVADGQDFLIWVSRETNGNPAIRLTDGGSIMKVSDDSVEKRLQSLTKIEDVQSFIIKINGHTLAVFNWTVDNFSIFYDTDTKTWNDLAMSNDDRYYLSCHGFFNNRHYGGSYRDASLYEISDLYLSNDGDNIHSLRILPSIHLDDMHPIEIGRVELDCVVGTGLNDTTPNHQDANPVVYLSASLDGGVTFGLPVTAPIGKIGVYQQRVIWNALGMYEKGCVLKIEHFNKVKFTMMGLDVMVRKLGY